jgi:hypothetical protein
MTLKSKMNLFISKLSRFRFPVYLKPYYNFCFPNYEMLTLSLLIEPAGYFKIIWFNLQVAETYYLYYGRDLMADLSFRFFCVCSKI